MIDYSKSYGYPRSCTLCGGGTYGHGICADCKASFYVGRVVKTAAGSFRMKDGQFQSRTNGAARFVDADISAFDCTCDSCTPDEEVLLLNAQTCPHCSCFFVNHDHDISACAADAPQATTRDDAAANDPITIDECPDLFAYLDEREDRPMLHPMTCACSACRDLDAYANTLDFGRYS